MACIRIPNGVICVEPDFKPGDQAPSGYLAWHEWAEVQHKAGLRQKQCGRCGKWHYPQELSGIVDRAELTSYNNRYRRSRKTQVPVETPVCNTCAALPQKA